MVDGYLKKIIIRQIHQIIYDIKFGIIFLEYVFKLLFLLLNISRFFAT